MQSRALYSKAEEELLGAIKSNSNPTLLTFEQHLKENPHVFFPSRSAKSLLAHWQLLKQYHLLPDQTVQPLSKNGPVKDFSEAEQQVSINAITGNPLHEYFFSSFERKLILRKHY